MIPEPRQTRVRKTRRRSSTAGEKEAAVSSDAHCTPPSAADSGTGNARRSIFGGGCPEGARTWSDHQRREVRRERSELDPIPGVRRGDGRRHFIVSDDVERSRRFYTDVLGGKTVIRGEQGDEVTYVALANSWIIINVGGGPTDDKPTVTLETPPDPDRVSSFLNIRVADIQAVYVEWSARGAQFLTPPKEHETEMRCYVRDPDGYLIEVGQTTLARGWRPPSS